MLRGGVEAELLEHFGDLGMDVLAGLSAGRECHDRRPAQCSVSAREATDRPPLRTQANTACGRCPSTPLGPYAGCYGIGGGGLGLGLVWDDHVVGNVADVREGPTRPLRSNPASGEIATRVSRENPARAARLGVRTVLAHGLSVQLRGWPFDSRTGAVVGAAVSSSRGGGAQRCRR